MLPNPAEYVKIDESDNKVFDGELTVAANKALEALREATDNCPACILAAIRQAGVPVPMVTDFHWTTEMKAVWTETPVGWKFGG